MVCIMGIDGEKMRTDSALLASRIRGAANHLISTIPATKMVIHPLEEIHETFAKKQKVAWDRTLQFWTRAINVYASYKVCEIKVKFVRGKEHQQRIWEQQHEIAGDKIYSMCYELGGFFLKAAQIIGKPDLAPNAWVVKLVTLCDRAPATPFERVQLMLERELGRNLSEIFERFDRNSVASASIAQVHRARIKGTASDVAVKVQHPGVQELMMTDIHNLKLFAAYLQKTDVNFDLVSLVNEMEKQVEFEFDFLREAKSMDRIANFLRETNYGKPPVIIPRSIPGMVTRRVLVMDFLEGIGFRHLGVEMAKRGIDSDGKLAKMAKRNILKNLTTAYGQMILKSGFFQADPHPGNILICNDGKVALLDYGQVKELPEGTRLGFASLVLALASGDALKMEQSFEELGIQTLKRAEDDPKAFKVMAQMLFDTRLPPGAKLVTPFGDESTLKKVPVQVCRFFIYWTKVNNVCSYITFLARGDSITKKNFPEELFFVIRTIHILRGISTSMGINYSCAEEWKKIAQEELSMIRGTNIKSKNFGSREIACRRS